MLTEADGSFSVILWGTLVSLLQPRYYSVILALEIAFDGNRQMETYWKITTFKAPLDVRERLEDTAKVTGRSLTAVILAALRRELELETEPVHAERQSPAFSSLETTLSEN